MKFTYPIPPEESSEEIDVRFLPSMAFTIFSLMEDSSEDETGEIYCRRIPQILKMKIDFLKRFNTRLAIPLGQQGGEKFFLRMRTDRFWEQNVFLPVRESHDYVIGGSLSYSRGKMLGRLYSTMEDSVIFSHEYEAEDGEFLDPVNDFLDDILHMVEIVPPPEIKNEIKTRPVKSPEGFHHLILALDYYPGNGVYQNGGEKYVENLKKALQHAPFSVDTAAELTRHARILFQRMETGKAEELVDFVLSGNPCEVFANILKTHILIQRSELDIALKRLDDMPCDDVDIARAPFVLAGDLMETHLSEPAERLFQKALDLGLEEAELFEKYCFLMVISGKNSKALEIIEKGVEKHPDREFSHLYYAQLLADLDRRGDAAAAYEDALQRFPDSTKLIASRAVFQVQNMEMDKAAESIEKALEKAPEDPNINLEAAKVYYQLGNTSLAERQARTAIELDPGSRLAGDAKEFLSRIESGITRTEQQKNRELYIKAKYLIDSGNPEEGVEILEKVTKREKYFWKAWFLKGIALRRLDRLDDALEAFNNIDDLFPDQVALHHEIGRCLMGKEKFTEASAHIFFAFRKKPEDPAIMANMGLIYLFTGKPSEAEMLLLQAQKMASTGTMNLKPYIEEARRVKKRKEAGRGNGDIKNTKVREINEDKEENQEN